LKIVVATGRQAHYRLFANSLSRRGNDVSIYTATPHSRLKGFDPAIASRLIPAPVAWFNGLTHMRTALFLDELDSAAFDQFCAWAVGDCDFLLGAASSSVLTARKVKSRGGIYVLDRACPDIRVQQRVMVEEAAKVGGRFKVNSPWFIERQMEEYELADVILAPSNYSATSYPERLQEKVVLAPIYGRAKVFPRQPKVAGSNFVLGVVGNDPLRKGYFYLLQAWKELALPNAELRIRSSADFTRYTVLAGLIASQPNVSVISYVPDIGAFYAGCDAFILPSIDEGFGMALFEALANGLPSIATRNCGASELLVAERDCLLIDAFSVDQIKQSILRLYESPELRTRLAEAGPAAVDALQEDGVAKPYEEGIERLLKATGSLPSRGAH
jgi:glycosyltransferase involved in cell wall biosynthesis